VQCIGEKMSSRVALFNPYLAMVADATNPVSEGGEYSTVRATYNAEVITQLARGSKVMNIKWV